MSDVVKGAAPGIPALEDVPLWRAVDGWLQGWIWVEPKAWENPVPMVTGYKSAILNPPPFAQSTDSNPSLSPTLPLTRRER